MSCCEVPAVVTLSGAGVTEVSMAVTLTGAAAREAPLSWLAVRALTPGGSLPALTLTGDRVTLVTQGALRVAVTGCTATDSKAVGSRCTLVTALPHHVGFTMTLTPHFITLPTEGALRVALTG